MKAEYAVMLTNRASADTPKQQTYQGCAGEVVYIEGIHLLLQVQTV